MTYEELKKEDMGDKLLEMFEGSEVDRQMDAHFD